MSLKLTAQELQALKNLRADNDRYGKKNWWVNIRSKYNLPAGVALKVELDGELAGELRYKATGVPLDDNFAPAAVDTDTLAQQYVPAVDTPAPDVAETPASDVTSDVNATADVPSAPDACSGCANADICADADADADADAGADFNAFLSSQMQDLQDLLDRVNASRPNFGVVTAGGALRLFTKASEAHNYALETGVSGILPVLN